jgi:hypothetical protein
MSRPKPTILLQDIDTDYKAYEVCEADHIYAVCYLGRPFMLRMHPNIEVPLIGPKYIKCSFTNSGHAFNLAEKLNIRFDTEDFSVVIMQPGRTLKESAE